MKSRLDLAGKAKQELRRAMRIAKGDAGKADGELAVVGVSQADARGFDEQTQLLGVHQRGLVFGGRCRDGECNGFLFGYDCLVERAVRETNPAFEALGKRSSAFEDDGHVKVAG
ncbi:MAG: hypothetical protein HY735_14840 [Verrucomicrobia bacterium]|nr:hypothetical protein [Verrucomicrobiota bacterium]